MNQLKTVREIMQWVSKSELKEKTFTIARLAEELDMPNSSVHRIVSKLYPECFIVEPYVGVRLSGKWPNDIPFDWETLEPLEVHDSRKKFREAKPKPDGFEPKTDWSTKRGDLAVADLIFRGKIEPIETFADLGEDDVIQLAISGLSTFVELLKLRGKKVQPGWFFKTTGLHFPDPKP